MKLTPAGSSVLVGVARFVPGARAKVMLSLTLMSQDPVRARFNLAAFAAGK